MTRDLGLVDTLPFLLSPADRIRTFNASQEVWAKILAVTLSSNQRWTYLKVVSNYVPDPYVICLASKTTVRARKRTPWRKTSPPEASSEVIKASLRVKTTIRHVKRPVTRSSAFDPLTWEEEERKKRRTVVDYTSRPKKKLFEEDDIGFIPDPTLEKERQKKRTYRKKKTRPKRSGLLGYYEVLGCKAGNRLSTIKRRFKKLALRWHPDRNPGDAAAEAKFKEINSAYQEIVKVLDK